MKVLVNNNQLAAYVWGLAQFPNLILDAQLKVPGTSYLEIAKALGGAENPTVHLRVEVVPDPEMIGDGGVLEVKSLPAPNQGSNAPDSTPQPTPAPTVETASKSDSPD